MFTDILQRHNLLLCELAQCLRKNLDTVSVVEKMQKNTDCCKEVYKTIHKLQPFTKFLQSKVNETVNKDLALMFAFMKCKNKISTEKENVIKCINKFTGILGFVYNNECRDKLRKAFLILLENICDVYNGINNDENISTKLDICLIQSKCVGQILDSYLCNSH